MCATVKPQATLADMKAHDVVVVVKRVPPDMLLNLRKSGRPWAYDIVDAYPQRDALFRSRGGAVQWARQFLKGLDPAMVIWPNARMREDVGMPGPVVYHHHRPGIALNPIRDRIRRVGYEGHVRYLDGVHDLLQAVCIKRGAELVVNPERLSDVDVVLAVRGPNWRSYASDNWKSNVKLANAHASGTPFIGPPEQGYVETGTGREYWARTPSEVALALDWLADPAARREVAKAFYLGRIKLEDTARQLQEALCALKS
jgi:hypothetical protein